MEVEVRLQGPVIMSQRKLLDIMHGSHPHHLNLNLTVSVSFWYFLSCFYLSHFLSLIFPVYFNVDGAIDDVFTPLSIYF